MSVTIMLDANALSKLIEAAGDEFKLKLSQAVLAEAMRRHVKAAAEGLIRQVASDAVMAIRPIIAGAVKEAVLNHFGAVDTAAGWNVRNGALKLEPTPALKQAIRDLATTAVAEAAREEITDLRAHATREADARMANAITTIDNRVAAAIDNAFKAAVDAAVKARIDAVMAAVQSA